MNGERWEVAEKRAGRQKPTLTEANKGQDMMENQKHQTLAWQLG